MGGAAAQEGPQAGPQNAFGPLRGGLPFKKPLSGASGRGSNDSTSEAALAVAPPESAGGHCLASYVVGCTFRKTR